MSAHTKQSAHAKHQAKPDETKHTQHRGGSTEPTQKRPATQDERLEQGLEESFPASDPIAVVQPAHSAHDTPKR
jgi:hypothetical protein